MLWNYISFGVPALRRVFWSACVFVHHCMPDVLSSGVGVDTLEIEFQMVLSHQVGAGN